MLNLRDQATQRFARARGTPPIPERAQVDNQILLQVAGIGLRHKGQRGTLIHIPQQSPFAALPSVDGRLA